jgi:hypothetical protein
MEGKILYRSEPYRNIEFECPVCHKKDKIFILMEDVFISLSCQYCSTEIDLKIE